MKYSDEFREEAVRLYLEGNRSVAAVSRDLGINHWTLRDWVRAHKAQHKSDVPRTQETPEQEVKRLRREMSVLRQEVDILKKAAAYFAKEHL